MRRILVVPLIAVLLVALGACGAKEGTAAADQPSAKSSESEATTTSTTAETTDRDKGASTDVSGDLSDVDLTECQQVASLYSALLMQSMSVYAPDADTSELDDLVGDLDEARDNVPDNIRDAFDKWSEAWTTYMTAMNEITSNGGFANPANLDKIQAASEVLESSEFEAASDELSQYFDRECNVAGS